jgi:sugar phosphate permease
VSSAVGLFITGPLGDRLNLRWFLGLGMMGAGLFCFGFGSAALIGVHHLAFFVAMNLGAGLFQATGWSDTRRRSDSDATHSPATSRGGAAIRLTSTRSLLPLLSPLNPRVVDLFVGSLGLPM